MFSVPDLAPVSCILSFVVKVCSWYKTHSNTGILAGVRYVFFLSVPGFQFGPVTVSFEAFCGHKTMMYTLKVGFTIVNNLIQHRGLVLAVFFTFAAVLRSPKFYKRL